MKYEDNYMMWRASIIRQLDNCLPKNGNEAEDVILSNTDDSELTERERVMCILPVIKWMIEHDMLTPECKDELDLYYEDFQNGKFDGLLGEDEEDEIRKDLFECYHKVFGE